MVPASSRARIAGALAALVAVWLTASSCGDSNGPANSVTRFISGVTTLDTSLHATLVRGTPPAAAGGPAVTISGGTSVINGGSSQITLSAGSSYNTVIIAVDGYPDYYVLTLPSGVTVADLIVTIAASLQAAGFDFSFGVGSGTSAIGPYSTQTTTVVQVGSGDIQVSVSWDVDSDVDLHLVEPGVSGEEIYYGNSTATSGGTLDLDSNAACNLDHVRNENITYPGVTPPHGTFTVRVDYWDNCSVAQTNYIVTVHVKGQTTKTFSGSFTGTGDAGGGGSGTTITTFSY